MTVFLLLFLGGLVHFGSANGWLPFKEPLSVLVACLAAITGMQAGWTDWPEILVALWAGGLTAANVTRGDIDWKNHKATICRFVLGFGALTKKFIPTGTAFAALPAVLYSLLWGSPTVAIVWAIWAVLGAAVAPIYVALVVNTPSWVKTSDDTASIPVGILLLGGLSIGALV